MRSKGTHIISNFYNCECDRKFLINHSLIKMIAEEKIRESGLTYLFSYFHSFGKNQGFTGMIILAESHFSIHTWPELNEVDLDIYVCNHTQNNTEKAKYIYAGLFALYAPKEEKHYRIER